MGVTIRTYAVEEFYHGYHRFARIRI